MYSDEACKGRDGLVYAFAVTVPTNGDVTDEKNSTFLDMTDGAATKYPILTPDLIKCCLNGDNLCKVVDGRLWTPGSIILVALKLFHKAGKYEEGDAIDTQRKQFLEHFKFVNVENISIVKSRDEENSDEEDEDDVPEEESFGKKLRKVGVQLFVGNAESVSLVLDVYSDCIKNRISMYPPVESQILLQHQKENRARMAIMRESDELEVETGDEWLTMFVAIQTYSHAKRSVKLLFSKTTKWQEDRTRLNMPDKDPSKELFRKLDMRYLRGTLMKNSFYPVS